jgi:hypothetical protein
MPKMKNPATAGCGRASDISSLARADARDATENHNAIQSEILAVRSIMRRYRVSFWYAKTICQLTGLGGRAA